MTNKNAMNDFKVGIVMDPISKIKPYKDSSFAMMLSAQDKGAELYYMEQDDVFIRDGASYGVAQKVKVMDDNDRWYALNEKEIIPLGSLDFIFMRKDPPVNKRFVHTCHILEQAVKDGAIVVNNPSTLFTFNEKLFATHFPEFCPSYMITSDFDVLYDFLNDQEQIIIKPLDAMGGQGVFMVDKSDVNFEVIWEVQTQNGTYPVVAQQFIPEISKGDSRILILNGEPFNHALVRLPKSGSIRGNIAAGGSTDVRPLNDKEREIAEVVGKRLLQEGIIFSGIDVIGDYLIEVNITSPTGLRELSKASATNPADLLIENIFKLI
jgi:glutathione synthase